MTAAEIFQTLTASFGADVVSGFDDGTKKVKDPGCEVAPWSLTRVAQRLKEDPALGFDYLECVTGVDWPKQNRITVVYHLYSYRLKHRFVLKVHLDRTDPVVPTVSGIWSAANWQERECYDLLGVLFDGHPDLRRLLLPEDWEGHPLRKDWQPPATYHGIPTSRPNPLDLLGEAASGAEPAGEPVPAKA